MFLLSNERWNASFTYHKFAEEMSFCRRHVRTLMRRARQLSACGLRLALDEEIMTRSCVISNRIEFARRPYLYSLITKEGTQERRFAQVDPYLQATILLRSPPKGTRCSICAMQDSKFLPHLLRIKHSHPTAVFKI